MKDLKPHLTPIFIFIEKYKKINPTVLHITNWYPTIQNKAEGIFIKEHIDSISEYTIGITYYIKNVFSWKIGVYTKVLPDKTILMEVNFPTKVWKIKEILITIAVIKVIFYNYSRIDLINFHIAYPLLTYWHLIKVFVKKPIICNEHWSAYPKNFNATNKANNNNKLNNIKRIFLNNILFLAVSAYLAKSIEKFSNTKIKYEVLNNVISNFYYYDGETNKSNFTFFMAAVWRPVKDPITIIKTFKTLTERYPNIKLRIAGTGFQINAMEELIHKLNLKKNVELLGELTKEGMATEMRRAIAFIHNSTIETFSVVCAEALCSGTPVIASKLPAIQEYLREGKDGFFVESNTTLNWLSSINNFIDSMGTFNNQEISERALKLFSKKVIGLKYFTFIQKELG